MPIELMCRKVGMTRIYAEGGESIPVTVLEAGPNVVVQKKTEDRLRTVLTGEQMKKYSAWVQEQLQKSPHRVMTGR